MCDDGVSESVGKRDIHASDPDGFKDAHLIVTCYNGVVLLAGQVATADLKRRAQDVAASVASTIPRIEKIVKVFEYLDQELCAHSTA